MRYRADIVDIIRRGDGTIVAPPSEYRVPCGMNSIKWIANYPCRYSNQMTLPGKALVLSEWKGQSLTGTYVPYNVLFHLEERNNPANWSNYGK
jgi:hypothetical protein